MFRRRLIEHLKGETPRLVCDMRYLTEDGTWRWARQHGIAFRGPDGRARRLVGASGDITELKQREFELQTAQERGATPVAVDRARASDDAESRYALALESISHESPAPTTPISKPAWCISRLACSRRPRSAGIRADHRLGRRDPSGRPPAAHPHGRGALPRRNLAARLRIPLSRHATAPGNGRASTASWCAGRTAARARMVGVTGEITETRQRERQLDAAKAEALAAQRDVEQARETMQLVLDNMTDGVTLWDKDFRWRFSNRRHMERWGYPPGMLYSRRLRPRAWSAIRSSAAPMARRRAISTPRSTRSPTRILQAGRQSLHPAHRGRPLHRIQFQAAERRQPARHLPRRHRAEGARGSARGGQGGGRGRARRRRARARRGDRGAQRRRAHAPGHADRARQHERRRHAVRP